jgi:hypothetical protein
LEQNVRLEAEQFRHPNRRAVLLAAAGVLQIT